VVYVVVINQSQTYPCPCPDQLGRSDCLSMSQRLVWVELLRGVEQREEGLWVAKEVVKEEALEAGEVVMVVGLFAEEVGEAYYCARNQKGAWERRDQHQKHLGLSMAGLNYAHRYSQQSDDVHH
jgi:hypothetical protein